MKTEVEIKIRAIQSAKVSPFANLLNKLQDIWQSVIPSIKCRIDWLKYNYQYLMISKKCNNYRAV